MIWSLQDAKNRFSEVVERARTEGPQRVSKHGREAVVIVSIEEWRAIEGKGRSLADFFADSPLAGSGLRIDRGDSLIRPVEL